MTTLTIDITFHTPYRVATGSASRGLDAVVDRDRIPATSLKGVMRAAADAILGLGPATIHGIFGSPTLPSPWSWSDVVLPRGDELAIRSRVQIAINPETGTAARGGLLHAEEIWVRDSLSFTIDDFGTCPTATRDAMLLAAAAMAVKGLGASRRRGLGWLTMSPAVDGTPVEPASAARAAIAARGRAQ